MPGAAQGRRVRTGLAQLCPLPGFGAAAALGSPAQASSCSAPHAAAPCTALGPCQAQLGVLRSLVFEIMLSLPGGMEEGQKTRSECWARQDDEHFFSKLMSEQLHRGQVDFSAAFDSLILFYTTHASAKCELHSVRSAEPAGVQENIA